MSITLDTPCFTIQNGQVVEARLRDFDRLIEESTRPHGVDKKTYLTPLKDADGNIVGWAVAEWATWGGPERIIEKFDDHAHAQARLEDLYVSEILDSEQETIYLTREDAEADLAQHGEANAG